MSNENLGYVEFLYKVLQVPVRRKIWTLLSSEGPLDLAEISERMRLSEMTVRHHLIMLEKAGLVISHKVHSGTVGRPRVVYDANRSIHYDLSFPKRQYFLMSKHILEALIKEHGMDEARRLMILIGKKVGESILSAMKPKLKAENSLQEFVKALESFLDELGCMPSIEVVSPNAVKIELRNCVYYELAKLYPDVICEGHKSLFNTLSKALGDYESVQESCMAKGARTCITLIKKVNRGINEPED